MATFTLEVEWLYPSLHGEELTAETLKRIVEGVDCSVECETAPVRVSSVVEVPNRAG
jgi:hypothetical protein